MKIFKNTFSKIFKTKNKIKETFSKVLSFRSLTKEDKEKMEECLLSSDLGWELTEKTLENLEKIEKNESWEDVLLKTLKSSVENLEINSSDIRKVILIVGVNGSGKTTSAAKLANFFKINNKSVTLVAADTYRAAAVNQLRLWSEMLGVGFIANDKSSDPASVAYDGVQSGIAKNVDYIIIDTAGRLQNSENLMNELEKVYRVISKLSDQITVVMNIDANIGQNSISQIENFSKYIPIENVILNKMDGTSKGGIAMSVIDKFKLPVSFIGIGEKMEDLIEFDMDDYLKSLINSTDDN